MNLIKGKKAVLEALITNQPLERLVLNQNLLKDHEGNEIINLAKTRRIKYQILPSNAFKTKYPEEYSQGIIAFILNKPFLEFKDIINNQEKFPFILAIDHLTDPYNFGAILRTAETFNISAVIFPKDRACHLTPGVIKASSGAIYHLNLVRVTNLSQSLEKLYQNNYQIYGADSNQGTDLEKIMPEFPLVMVVGNEEKGISYNIQKKLTSKIHIKMQGKISSLNVSVATGIILYNFSRKFSTSSV